ncbi:MAG: hypothetical protein CK528_03405 [Alcaligenaceae bacterium]|nr:MAG: hypothetical protein CK528_03405 [Alcaligenaceae bacterium]
MEIQLESHSEDVTLVILIGKLDLMGAQAIDTRLGATANARSLSSGRRGMRVLGNVWIPGIFFC